MRERLGNSERDRPGSRSGTDRWEKRSVESSTTPPPDPRSFPRNHRAPLLSLFVPAADPFENGLRRVQAPRCRYWAPKGVQGRSSHLASGIRGRLNEARSSLQTTGTSLGAQKDNRVGSVTSDAVSMGPGGLEPPTSPLSGVRSNQLSYEPVVSGLDRSNSVSNPDARASRDFPSPRPQIAQQGLHQILERHDPEGPPRRILHDPHGSACLAKGLQGHEHRSSGVQPRDGLID